MEHRDKLRGWMLVLTLGLCLSTSGPRAQEDGNAEALHPIVAGVLELLEQGLDEKVIRRWLATQPSIERPMTAGELVRLEAAGASNGLLQRMIGNSSSAGVDVTHANLVFGKPLAIVVVIELDVGQSLPRIHLLIRFLGDALGDDPPV